MKSTLVAYVLFALAGAAGLYAAYLALRVYFSGTWPTARARILDSGVIEEGGRDRLGSRGRFGYRAVIEYEFSAGGRTIRSDRIRIAGPAHRAGFIGDAGKVRRCYPRGAEVTVYYNPEDPTDCGLERSTPYIAIAAGVALVGAVGGAYLLFA